MAASSEAETNDPGVGGEPSEVLQVSPDQQSGTTPNTQDYETLKEEGPSYYPQSLPYFLEENLSFFEGDVVKRLIRLNRSGRNTEEDKAKIIRSIGLIDAYKPYKRSKKKRYKLELAFEKLKQDHMYHSFREIAMEGGHLELIGFYSKGQLPNCYLVDMFINCLIQRDPDIYLEDFKKRVQEY